MSDTVMNTSDSISRPPPAGRRKPMRESLLPWITTPALLILLIGTWHFYIEATKLSAFILPSPYAVWDAWIGLLQSSRAWSHTLATIYVTLVGFAWALVIGVGLGVLLGRIRWLELTLNPFVVATQVIP